MKNQFNITERRVNAYIIPTDGPEEDGTLEWNSTTLILVSLNADNKEGIGNTYAHVSVGRLIEDTLFPIIKDRNALEIPALWNDMVRAIRNFGRPGICSSAIAAGDNALWDLKAKLLNISLSDLFGRAKDRIPVYGSGDFTNYSVER